jgi:hypothetical protein
MHVAARRPSCPNGEGSSSALKPERREIRRHVERQGDWVDLLGRGLDPNGSERRRRRNGPYSAGAGIADIRGSNRPSPVGFISTRRSWCLFRVERWPIETMVVPGRVSRSIR